MPQLDFIIIFPQIFLIVDNFLFDLYNTYLFFFLPIFVKTLKARKRIILENSMLLVSTQNKFISKQAYLNNLLNKNFYLIKSILETELGSIFSSKNILDLNSVDIKLVKVIYNTTLYYDLNILDSVPLSPKFSFLNFKDKF
uniref:ATP synthase F0 subunit 8 n=1 Tax=Lithothamnion sp. TaxID=1940749 RepID=A0A3G3MID0_9FLOR|nr:ATP synthase F0 subunit 8 [Lithothamnion sp.]